jgi:hypothetical protein
MKPASGLSRSSNSLTGHYTGSYWCPYSARIEEDGHEEDS